MSENNFYVNSEIGTLQQLLIHSPDGGIGKVVPGKFKEWLYDDTVHLTQMRREYNEYIKILLYFLDPEKIPYILNFEKKQSSYKQPDCYKPGHKDYFNSTKVLDTQYLLSKILEEDALRHRIISAVCAWEGCSFSTEKKLEAIDSSAELAKILISGVLHTSDKHVREFVFPPLANFIFTRDIGIMINRHLLLSNAATPARERESLLMKFIAYNGLFKNCSERVIEISESSDFFLLNESEQKDFKTSVEGGDVMMISPHHILLGCSERTTPNAIDEIIHALFKNADTNIEKITVIKIPRQRAIMHIDTIFTQVSRNTWVLFGKYSERAMQQKNEMQYGNYRLFLDKEEELDYEQIEIFRFYKPLQEPYSPGKNYQQSIQFAGLEALLINISTEDFQIEEENVQIIYSGNNIFPFDEREQWTDSCNLLVLKEGVAIGYDRNEITAQSFEAAGYRVIHSKDLLEKLNQKEWKPDDIEKTLILLPSAELSRARGGAHCMSMPLLRNSIL